jgi:hypothetical protein
MTRLVKSKARGRKIRQDDAAELSIPTFALVRRAMQAGKLDEAIELLEYGEQEDTQIHDALVRTIDAFCRYIAENFGEDEIPKAFRLMLYKSAEEWLKTPETKDLLQRSHHGNFTITEEPDRYVVRCDPCGSGGRLRKTSKPGTIGVTKKGYPWSWGKAGVPYYCCHCCLMHDIIPTEIRGYPVRITNPGDKPDDPCIHYYYKKPELIPEEYFTRIGMKKPKTK